MRKGKSCKWAPSFPSCAEHCQRDSFHIHSTQNIKVYDMTGGQGVKVTTAVFSEDMKRYTDSTNHNADFIRKPNHDPLCLRMPPTGKWCPQLVNGTPNSPYTSPTNIPIHAGSNCIPNGSISKRMQTTSEHMQKGIPILRNWEKVHKLCNSTPLLGKAN